MGYHNCGFAESLFTMLSTVQTLQATSKTHVDLGFAAPN